MQETIEKLAVFDGDTIQIQSLEDIWMTQKQMAEMFGKDVKTINHHVIEVKKELADWEGLNSVISKNEITASDGKKYNTEVYGFEFICQVGYKVNSVAGMKFRQFATKAVMEKINRDLLGKDEEINALLKDNESMKAKLGEAVMEISALEQIVDYQKQFVPNEADYGKIAPNGYPRVTYQKGGFKSRNGRKVRLKSPYIQLDLIAIGKYLTE